MSTWETLMYMREGERRVRAQYLALYAQYDAGLIGSKS